MFYDCYDCHRTFSYGEVLEQADVIVVNHIARDEHIDGNVDGKLEDEMLPAWTADEDGPHDGSARTA